MKKARVLFVSSEIMPYVEDGHVSKLARKLPQGIQEKGKEIRTFMPKYGSINERRNQLHEVIRLSGMNIIINDNDHQLIIKVASIQAARMQVYFIDNEEFFKRKFVVTDENGNSFEDNEERAIFFCRGVIETVKKLGWNPDVIHCHGWMAAPMPLLIKKMYKDDPLFANSKIVYSVYNDDFPNSYSANYVEKVKFAGVAKDDIKHLKEPTFVNVTKTAIQHSDAIIVGQENIHPDLLKHIKTVEKDKPVLSLQTEDQLVEAYNNFYDMVLQETLV